MRNWVILATLMLVVVLAVTACGPETPAAPSVPPSSPPTAPTAAISAATTAPKATSSPTSAPAKATAPAAASPTTAAKAGLTCPPVQPLAANTPLAARVNGVGISLDAFNRQAAQAQAAMTQNGGLDPKTQAGQDTIKSLRQQVLDQMINDVVVAMLADQQGVKVTDDDLNARLAQMIQDAGGQDKLNDYLTKQQLTLADLCSQVRNQLLGEAMLNNVTASFPTKAPQVHVRQILVPTAAEADALLKQLQNGADFATLAKQYSKDEASAPNGGDLGWFPKGVMDPTFEGVAFQLKINEVSQVVTTQFGFHIIQLLEKDDSRPLPAEVLQNQRQQAFLAWLQAERGTMKIDRLVQP